MSKIFLSYARKDGGELAEHLFHRLGGCGYEIFKDDHHIRLGDPVTRAISDALEGEGTFIVIMTRAALGSAWVEDEINMALTARRRVISVLADDVRDNEIPLQQRKLNYLRMSNIADWHALNHLVDSLDNGKDIPRAYNMSGHNDIGVRGVLVLGHSGFGMVDLSNPATITEVSRKMAQDALPYIQAEAGIVPHGHPALACGILAFLLGAYNVMPKLFYTFKIDEKFWISDQNFLALQEIREAGFDHRSSYK